MCTREGAAADCVLRMHGPPTRAPVAARPQVYKRAHWTETFVQWSPLGTYITTLHRQGTAVWGGPGWERINRFAHAGVRLLEYSPNERYLITYSSQEPHGPHEKVRAHAAVRERETEVERLPSRAARPRRRRARSLRWQCPQRACSRPPPRGSCLCRSRGGRRGARRVTGVCAFGGASLLLSSSSRR